MNSESNVTISEQLDTESESKICRIMENISMPLKYIIWG